LASDGWLGLFAPDNGIINVPLMLRTLYRLAQTYGAGLLQNTDVKVIKPSSIPKSKAWEVHAVTTTGVATHFLCDKIIITSGAYTNQVLTPSFDCHLDLAIWEMVASYWSVNPGPRGTIFPSKLPVSGNLGSTMN
jgi:sarcosine oxidase/L-pipecolate oxidase